MLYGILVVGMLSAVWTVLYSAGVFRQRPHAFASAGDVLHRRSLQPSSLPERSSQIAVTRAQPALPAASKVVDDKAAGLARSARI